MTTPQTDIVSVAIAITGAFIGSQLSPYIGPYLVIAISAAVGASCFALPRMGPMNSVATYKFIFAMSAIACLLTIGIAELIENYFNIGPGWTVAPIGLVIGGVGKDWIKVGQWFAKFAGRFVEQKTGVNGSGK